MTVTFNTWISRVNNAFVAEARLSESVRAYVDWLDWLVENLNGGTKTTTVEDFDALYDIFRFSAAYKKLEQYPEVLNAVMSASDATLELCEEFEREEASDEALKKFDEVLNKFAETIEAARDEIETLDELEADDDDDEEEEEEEPATLSDL